MTGWVTRARASAAVPAMILLVLGAAIGCSAAAPEPGPQPSTAVRGHPRDLLAGLAAAAKDQRYVATYTLTTADQPGRTVTVAKATDGSWVVAIPAGALGGLADLAVFSPGDVLYQCVLGPAAGTTGRRPDLEPIQPGCAEVSGLDARTDPRVQHLFTDWIDPLVDPATALSIVAAPVLEGATGSCFSVESNSAALTPPVDPGIYCYRSDGLLTAARVGFGTLVLTGPVGLAPPSVAIPAPVVDRDPVPVTAPAPPPPSTPIA